MIGKNHRKALVTLVERRSQMVRIGRVESRHAESVATTMIHMLKPLATVSHTLALDNGKEFALHENVEARTGIKI